MFLPWAGRFFELELQTTSIRSEPSYILLAYELVPFATLSPLQPLFPPTSSPSLLPAAEQPEGPQSVSFSSVQLLPELS